ncbi:homoserine O-acetyltransferase [Lysobacter sp. TLK-CK17T]|uniref:Homoserine O-acetyltransferase n=1 Tax=Marilutibacter chinensis TaxID=2912247 RepID=A0ABS9HTX4_9GAMM|nr:homoserine O-acetyltransferase [Lysobacter chinensis]
MALELGGMLPTYSLAYRTWGRLSEDADNAVVVCHALTGASDADVWWKDLFGEGKALDPCKDFIVCSNSLGSCYGSTGPTTLHPDGKRWGARFPKITIRDQVHAQMALADALGIRRIRLVVGGSMGGLQVLEWALLDQDRVESIAVVAASALHSSWCIAWSATQRMSIHSDPGFSNGDYAVEAPPRKGLGIARAIAMATYRSHGSLGMRYGRITGIEAFGSNAKAPKEFAVRNWVAHHAESFADRFDANSYLTLIDAMDTHDVGRGRGGVDAALAGVKVPALVISIDSDALYVPAEQACLFEGIPDARLVEITSLHGHDGFLIDAARLEPAIREFRDDLSSRARGDTFISRETASYA